MTFIAFARIEMEMMFDWLTGRLLREAESYGPGNLPSIEPRGLCSLSMALDPCPVKNGRGVTLSLVMAALCHQGGHEVAFFVFTANGLVEVPHRFETNVDPVALDWLSQFNCIGQSSLKPLQESVDRFGGAEVVVLSDFMWADVYTELEALRTSSLSPFH